MFAPFPDSLEFFKIYFKTLVLVGSKPELSIATIVGLGSVVLLFELIKVLNAEATLAISGLQSPPEFPEMILSLKTLRGLGLIGIAIASTSKREVSRYKIINESQGHI